MSVQTTLGFSTALIKMVGGDHGHVEKPLTKAEAKKAMARFESLTRQLLAVPRERLKDEQERYAVQPHRTSIGNALVRP